jgi:hypothetical protein
VRWKNIYTLLAYRIGLSRVSDKRDGPEEVLRSIDLFSCARAHKIADLSRGTSPLLAK